MDLQTFGWISSAVGLLLFWYLWISYNSFIRSRNQVKTDFADVDVQLRRRASLIENLAAVVREYAKHEKGTFEEVTKARAALNDSKSPKESAQADNMLSGVLKSLFAVSEAYPKLQASENYQRLQDDLKGTEDSIANYRETYNQSVLSYNTLIQMFPNLLPAGLFNFKEEELFEPGAHGREEIKL